MTNYYSFFCNGGGEDHGLSEKNNKKNKKCRY